jgi:hypothetical protein
MNKKSISLGFSALLIVMAMFVTVKPAEATFTALCHKTGNGFNYLVVANSAVSAHMAHGDYLYAGGTFKGITDSYRDRWCNGHKPTPSPAASATPTTVPSTTPTASASASPSPTATPYVTSEPTATPTPTSTPEGTPRRDITSNLSDCKGPYVPDTGCPKPTDPPTGTGGGEDLPHTGGGLSVLSLLAMIPVAMTGLYLKRRFPKWSAKQS